MKIKEAYQVLGVKEDISEEELKKVYRKAAVSNHPDKGGDVNKMKEINEAHQLIQDYRKNPGKYNQQQFKNVNNGFVNFSDFFNQNTNGGQQFNAQPINIKQKISFKESILGCNKEILYKRQAKCEDCEGNGQKTISNGCNACNGFGRIIKNYGNQVMHSTCNKCFGQNITFKNCEKCLGKATLENEISGTITIQPGTPTNTVLQLRQMGNFAGNSLFGDAYSDVHITVEVEPYQNLKLSGQDVVSDVTISLLDALKGCSREIETIYGKETITIQEQFKNKDEVQLKNKGVKNTNGSHRVIINVEYPKDISKLIGVLS